MIVSCPSCGKRYMVDDDAISTGRLVRCFFCSTTWFQEKKDGLFYTRDLRSYVSQGVLWMLLGITSGFIVSTCVIPRFLPLRNVYLHSVQVEDVRLLDKKVLCTLKVEFNNHNNTTQTVRRYLCINRKRKRFYTIDTLPGISMTHFYNVEIDNFGTYQIEFVA